MGNFLTANWQNLLMINYEVDADILLPYLPANTELDFYNNKCFVSIVGFMFLNTKIKGISIPFHKNFEELNLRFYVVRKDEKLIKRGVVFIKEIVPKPAISLVANAFYNEKYVSMPMQHSITKLQNENSIEYSFKHNNIWQSIKAITNANTCQIQKNSEEEFIAEHYYGYTKFTNNITFEYEVKHPKWDMLTVKNVAVNMQFNKIYNPCFAKYLQAKPSSVFVANGSYVQVGNKKIIKN